MNGLLLAVSQLINAQSGTAGQLRDVKPPVVENFALLPLVLGILASAAVLALVVWILRCSRRPRRKPAPPPVSPWDKALKEFEALQRENLPQKGEAAQFYFRLSGILRRYIEDRFAVRAPEMTTDEFLQAIRGRDVFNDGQKDLLKQFLTGSDMAKFARYAPAAEQMSAHFDLAVNFVQTTKNAEKSEK